MNPYLGSAQIPQTSPAIVRPSARSQKYLRDLLCAVKDMSNGVNAADESKGGKKLYSVNVQVKAQSSTSCSFCWFVMTLHPTLKEMPERDEATFRAHLVKAHRLQEEIQP